MKQSATCDNGLLLTPSDSNWGELTGDLPPSYLPVQSPDTASVRDLLIAVRCAEEQQSWQAQCPASNAVVERLIARLDASLERALAGCTLKDLVVERMANGAERGDEGG